MKKLNLLNQKFGRLTVISQEKSKGGKTIWKCLCDCGNITTVTSTNLTCGKINSCGCLRKEQITHRNTTHNLTKTQIYKVWKSIKQRCYNKKLPCYKNYGGRGICVCEEWINSFESFYDWSMKNGYTDSMTIERKDNDGNYCPGNCRWATQKEQCRNRSTNAVFEYMGEKHILTEWCEILNLEYKLVHNRIRKHGWSFERAISTPKTYSRK